MSHYFEEGPRPVNPLLGVKEREYLWALVYGHEWGTPRSVADRNRAKVTKNKLKAKAARLPTTLKTFFDDAAMLAAYFLLDGETGLLRDGVQRFANSEEFLYNFRNFCDIWLTSTAKSRILEDLLWGAPGREGSGKPYNFLTEELPIETRIDLLAAFVEALEFDDANLARVHRKATTALRGLAQVLKESRASGRGLPVMYGPDETRIRLRIVDEAQGAEEDREWLRSLDAKAGNRPYPFVEFGRLRMAYVFRPAAFAFTVLVLRYYTQRKPTSPRDVLTSLRAELESQLTGQAEAWVGASVITQRQVALLHRRAASIWDRAGSPARDGRGPGWAGEIRKLLKAMVDRGLAYPTGRMFTPTQRALEIMKRGGVAGLFFVG